MNQAQRIIGIDYGSKRVGIAVSDETGGFALPEKGLKNMGGKKADRKNNQTTLGKTDLLAPLVDEVAALAVEVGAGEFVVGESRNNDGEENEIMKDARLFMGELEKKTGLPVHVEPEFMTSVQAARFQGETELLDASAAAIILQSFLDRRNGPMPESLDDNDLGE